MAIIIRTKVSGISDVEKLAAALDKSADAALKKAKADGVANKEQQKLITNSKAAAAELVKVSQGATSSKDAATSLFKAISSLNAGFKSSISWTSNQTKQYKDLLATAYKAKTALEKFSATNRTALADTAEFTAGIGYLSKKLKQKIGLTYDHIAAMEADQMALKKAASAQNSYSAKLAEMKLLESGLTTTINSKVKALNAEIAAYTKLHAAGVKPNKIFDDKTGNLVGSWSAQWKSHLEAANRELQKMVLSEKEVKEAASKVTSEYAKLGRYKLGLGADEFKRATIELNKLGFSAKEASIMVRTLGASASIAAAKTVKGATMSAAAMSTVHAAVRGISGALGKLWLTYGNIGTMLAGFAAAGASKDIVKLGSSFEYLVKKAYSLEKTSGKATMTFREMKNSLLGFKDLRIGPVELAKGLVEAEQAGMSAKKALKGFKEVADAAAFSNMEFATAIKLTLGQAKAYGREMDETANVIFAVANASRASYETMLKGMGNATQLATSLNTTLEETAALMAVVTSAGIGEAQAGTAIKTGSMYLASAKALKELGKYGYTVVDSEGNLKSTIELWKSFGEALGRVKNEGEQLDIILKVLGVRASKAMSLVTAKDDLDKYIVSARKANEGVGAIARTTENLGSTSTIVFDKLKVDIEQAFIKSFEDEKMTSVLKEVRSFVNGPTFTELITGLSSATLGFLQAIAKGFTLLDNINNSIIDTLSQLQDLDVAKTQGFFMADISEMEANRSDLERISKLLGSLLVKPKSEWTKEDVKNYREATTALHIYQEQFEDFKEASGPINYLRKKYTDLDETIDATIDKTKSLLVIGSSITPPDLGEQSIIKTTEAVKDLGSESKKTVDDLEVFLSKTNDTLTSLGLTFDTVIDSSTFVDGKIASVSKKTLKDYWDNYESITTSTLTEVEKKIYDIEAAYSDARIEMGLLFPQTEEELELLKLLNEQRDILIDKVLPHIEPKNKKQKPEPSEPGYSEIERKQKLYVASLSEEQQQLYEISAKYAEMNTQLKELNLSKEEYTDLSFRLFLKEREEVTKLSDDYRTKLIKGVEDWGKSFKTTLNDMLWGAETTFENILESFGKMITGMILQMDVSDMKNFFGLFTGFFSSSTSSIDSGLGNLITGIQNAKGNVFNTPGLSAYSNSIVNKPTVFPFASGIGLMGEAGPEAIMPLTRTSGGDLGVKAEGVGGVNVIINNNTQAQAEVTEMKRADGGKDIVVTIDEIVGQAIGSGRGSTFNALQSMFGARPVLTGR